MRLISRWCCFRGRENSQRGDLLRNRNTAFKWESSVSEYASRAHIAFTMLSVIFFASPSSIIVLSR